MAELSWCNLGRVAYEDALRAQRSLHRRAVEGSTDDVLLLCEHDPSVITLGRGAGREHILADAATLAAAGVKVIETRRGGDVTYHGPGQLVGYPIFSLVDRGRDVKAFLRRLEGVLIRLLGRFGLQGERVEGLTGVWVGGAKIAAIGVAVRRWVTYHGLALNVCVDLSHYRWIIPCGIHDKPVTSLTEVLGHDVTVEEVVDPLVECFVEAFGFEAARQTTFDLPAAG